MRWYLSFALVFCLATVSVTNPIAASSVLASAPKGASSVSGGPGEAAALGETIGKGWYIGGGGIESSPAEPDRVTPVGAGPDEVDDFGEDALAVAPGSDAEPPPPPILPGLTASAPAVGEALDILPERAKSKAAPNRVRELTSLRTANSSHYLNDDGSITAEISAAPVNYLDAAGRWQPIDLCPRAVAAEKGGGYRVDRTPVPVTLPAEAGGIVRLTLRGAKAVEMAPLGAQSSQGALEGSRVVYHDAWPDVDLVEQATPGGVKELLILKNPGAPSLFEFSLAVTGTEWRAEELPSEAGPGSGGWDLLEAGTGRRLLTFPPLTLTDAAGAEGSAALTLSRDGDEAVLTLELGRAWLEDPARVFPVELDPTATVRGASDDSYVDSAYPETNYGEANRLKVGTTRRAFVRWDISSIPEHVTISSAIAFLHETGASGAQYMSPVTSAWQEADVCWNNQPSYAAEVAWQGESVEEGLEWDITAAFCLWTQGALPNYGMAVRTNGSASYESTETVYTSHVPKLEVTYTSGTDGLGLEDFWQFESRSLANGWSLAVNTASHNIVLGKTLFSISGRGPNLAEGLTYNSRVYDTDCGVGNGWRLATDMTLSEVTLGGAAFVNIVTEDGTTVQYQSDGHGGYTTPPGTFRTLDKVEDGVFTLTDKHQTVWRFEDGYLVSVADRNGNTLTIQRADGRIETQTEASGARSLVYEYGEDGRVSNITARGDRVYSLGYDAGGNLVSVTDPCGYEVLLDYDASGAPTFTDARGGTTAVYGGSDPLDDVVIRDPRSDAETSYDTTIHTSLSGVTISTRVTDPGGRWVDYEQDPVTWNPTKMVDALGNTTDWIWEDNLKTKETLPGDAPRGYTTWTYDVDGNVTHSKTYCPGAYGSTNYTYLEQDLDYDQKDRPVDFTDANGRVISLDYDSSGNLLSAIDQDLKTVNGLEYDENGNPLEFTPLGSGHLLSVANASYERANPDGTVEGWGPSGISGHAKPSIVVDPTVAIYGQCSGKIEATDPETYAFYRALPHVLANDAYTLSVDLRLDDVEASEGHGVRLRVTFTSDTETLTGYGPWYRGTGTLRAVYTGTAPFTDIASMGFEVNHATGTIWVDGFQVEVAPNAAQGSAMSGFNSVEDGCFNSDTSSWSVVVDQGQGSFARDSESTEPWSGAFGRIVAGSGGCTLRVYQRVPVNDAEEFTAGAVVETTNATEAKVRVDFYDSANSHLSCKESKSLSGTFHRWLRLAFAADAPPTAAYAYITVYFQGPLGSSMFFDNVEMTPKTTTVMEWDAGGNYRTASMDPLDNRDEFAYDEVGSRTSVEDGNGNAVGYTYAYVGCTG